MYKFRSFVSYINSIGLYNTVAYIINRFLLKKALFSVKAKGIKEKILLRGNSTDVNVFQQLFIKKDLAFLKGKNLEIIIDAGANIGLATIYMKNLFPNAYVYAIEPETNNFEILMKNTKMYSNITTINKALSGDSQGLYLIDPGKGSDAFQTKKNGNESVIKKIESISIADIIRDYNLSKLDCVKIDIEGAEQYCLNANAMDWINLTKLLAVEIHEHLAAGSDKQIKTLLKDFIFATHGEYSVFENTNLSTPSTTN